MLRREKEALRWAAEELQGLVFDLGCGHQAIRGMLAPACRYVGLDYFATATAWYASRPAIFGDAQLLPFAPGSANHVLLLDVLEHLARPELCIAEVRRVLRPGGTLVLQVPFLYPLHDVPLDFQRWTAFGLRKLAQEHGFEVIEERQVGRPVETACLLLNLALSKAVLDGLRRRSPVAFGVILLPFAVLALNLSGWLGSLGRAEDHFMPSAYRARWRRSDRAANPDQP